MKINIVKKGIITLGLIIFSIISCTNKEKEPISKLLSSTLSISDETLVSADLDKNNWLTHGRTYNEDRYSPLTQINKSN